LEKGDFLVGEPPDFSAVDGKCAKQLVALSQRYRQVAAGAKANDVPHRGGALSLLVSDEIVNPDDVFAVVDEPMSRTTGRWDVRLARALDQLRRTPMPSDAMKPLPIPSHHQPKCRLAEPACPFEHRVEHRRKIAGR
jgi:hypothetical protein